MKCIWGCGSVALIIGIGVLLGGYLPNALFNDRVVTKICKQNVVVIPYWCRKGGITSTCYNVVETIMAEGMSCGTNIVLATFTNQAEASKYANQWQRGQFSCYIDPHNVCTYYTSLADVTGTLYAGITFCSLATVIYMTLVIYTWWTRKSYESI